MYITSKGQHIQLELAAATELKAFCTNQWVQGHLDHFEVEDSHESCEELVQGQSQSHSHLRSKHCKQETGLGEDFQNGV
jgi:hypothetical protein